MYENYETLKISRKKNILTVSFNRPELKNATDPQMHQEIIRVFAEISKDEQTDVVILTGEGSAFSAGGDLVAMQASISDQERWLDAMQEARDILYGVVDLEKPVIAKINGHAMGMGATLALFSDITIANEKAKIADTHVNVGLVAGDGGAIIWPALIGYARAKKHLLTGLPISGKEAAEIGLVSEAVPLEELDARVDELAEHMAALPPVALRMTKKSVNMGVRELLNSMIEAHLGYETLSHLSADHKEAVDAFVEKRPADFKKNS